LCAPSIARDGPDHPAFGSCRTIYDPTERTKLPKKTFEEKKKKKTFFILSYFTISLKKEEEDKHSKRNSYRHLFIFFLRFPNYFDREEGREGIERAGRQLRRNVLLTDISCL
jgi:hypothetical protein